MESTPQTASLQTEGFSTGFSTGQLTSLDTPPLVGFLHARSPV